MSYLSVPETQKVAHVMHVGDNVDLIIDGRPVMHLVYGPLTFGQIDSCVSVFTQTAEALGARVVEVRVSGRESYEPGMPVFR